MRQFLRYPITRELKRYLNAHKEWVILTDARLRPIVAREGETDSIPNRVFVNAVMALRQKIGDVKTVVPVYVLHTHHHSHGTSPSPADVDFSLDFKREGYSLGKNILYLGEGVLTDKGVVIVSYTENRARLYAMGRLLPGIYRLKTREKLDKLYPTGEASEVRWGRARERAFKDMVKATDGIDAKYVRKASRNTSSVRSRRRGY